jgi:gliding motility-associated-like protein
MPKASSCYKIEAVNEFGCKATDDVCVEVTTNYNIYIPNIFTPNNDEMNDVFLVYGTGLSDFEMIIFDRWGERLFTSNDQLKGWDGTYKDKLCKNDVYPYLIKYKSLDGKKHTKTGHVTILK